MEETEVEMVGWHHGFNGYEFGHTLGNDERRVRTWPCQPRLPLLRSWRRGLVTDCTGLLPEVSSLLGL